jgi:hypothetical protein
MTPADRLAVYLRDRGSLTPAQQRRWTKKMRHALRKGQQ